MPRVMKQIAKNTMSIRYSSIALLFVAFSVACAGQGPKVDPPTPPTTTATATETATRAWVPEDAATGLTDPAVVSLFERHWTWVLERSPEWATELGVHRFDDRLEDNSKEALEQERQQRRAFLEEARAQAARPELVPKDALAVKLLEGALAADVASEVCELEEWSISPRNNPVTRWNYLPEMHAVRTVKDGENLIARYRAIPAHTDHQIEALRRGLAKGLVGNAETTRRVIEMVEKQLDTPLEQWTLLDPTKADHPTWGSGERAAYRSTLEQIVRVEVKPALTRYLRLLQQEIAPKARPESKSGLGALPLGAACYEARIQSFTSLPLEAKELHETGKKEIARIDSELVKLGTKLFKKRKLSQILETLRTDRALYFETAEQIEEKAKTSLALARSKLPEWFGVLPQASCEVARIPEYEAPYTTIAYYRAPVPGGARPGRYFVNVYAPETRPRYEAAVLAYHESIPGHHVQIALAQELPDVPAFLRHAGTDAFVEGWALYSERLAEEMGLYESDLDRIGMLSFDAWRAARLVVDTGIHSMGWSREQAVQYMLAHTALAENNIRNEVDRYIVWPAQALAYKTGQLEISKLRQDAEKRLGKNFDIRRFHDAVLLGGAVSLPVLREQVEAWVASAGAE